MNAPKSINVIPQLERDLSNKVCKNAYWTQKPVRLAYIRASTHYFIYLFIKLIT